MLFDLRSRGRRRTVQATYLGLAILMGAGLVLFGVGTGVGGGGLLNGIGGSGGGGSQKQVVSQQEKAALAQVNANPNSAPAWGNLLQARWESAGQGSNFDTSTQSFTASGRRELQGAAQAWQRYLALAKTPDPSLAGLAAKVYVGLNDWAGVAAAQEQLTSSEPNVPKAYACLAFAAYAAGQTRKAELASAKALSVSPKSQQVQTNQFIQQAKGSASAAQTVYVQNC